MFDLNSYNKCNALCNDVSCKRSECSTCCNGFMCIPHDVRLSLSCAFKVDELLVVTNHNLFPATNVN